MLTLRDAVTDWLLDVLPTEERRIRRATPAYLFRLTHRLYEGGLVQFLKDCNGATTITTQDSIALGIFEAEE